jgi:hypothetical protein
MSDISPVGTLAECADELNDFVNTLERYPPAVLAFALRTHLCGLLQALNIQGEWNAAEIQTFMEEMSREVLEGLRV